MRIKQTRLEWFFVRPRICKKDNEGSTYEEWGDAVAFSGECWPASGNVQAAEYGDRLSYIRNMRIEGPYRITADSTGVPVYDFGGGLKLKERDGVCIYVGSDAEPDYHIRSIKPYRPLRLEVEHV